MKKFLFFLLLGLNFDTYSSCLVDVRSSFEKLKFEATPLAVWTNNKFKGRSYTQALVNGFGLDNHFQGVLRLPGTSQFLLSGGDIYRKTGNLFAFDIASQNGKEFLDKNFKKRPRQTPKSDKFLWRMEVGNKQQWHPGGMAQLGNLVAVPIEDYKITNTAQIIFLDMNKASDPIILPIKIEKKHADAGNASMFIDTDGKIILGTYTGGTLEFYRSKTSNILDGFEEETKVIHSDAGGSSTQVLQQCDGKTFIIDFENDGKTPPIFNGLDKARLYSFDYKNLKVDVLSTKYFESRGFCNFSSAATSYVSETGKLALYSTQFFRNWLGNRVKLCQIVQD
jgi:hypothetical protein